MTRLRDPHGMPPVRTWLTEGLGGRRFDLVSAPLRASAASRRATSASVEPGAIAQPPAAEVMIYHLRIDSCMPSMCLSVVLPSAVSAVELTKEAAVMAA